MTARRTRRSPARPPGVSAGLAGLALVGAGLAGCTSGAASQSAGVSGIPTSLAYETSVAAPLTSVVSGIDNALDSCALLDLSASKVEDLTGVTLPAGPPRNPGELRSMCTYGGPDPEPPTRLPADVGDPTTDAGTTPSTVTASVVVPAVSPREAVAAQPAMLAAVYRCSELRGDTSGLRVGEAAAGAPPASGKAVDRPLVDCAASPTGGGTEVHVIFADGTRMWHLASVQPSVPRTPASESEAIRGLHALAAKISG